MPRHESSPQSSLGLPTHTISALQEELRNRCTAKLTTHTPVGIDNHASKLSADITLSPSVVLADLDCYPPYALRTTRDSQGVTVDSQQYELIVPGFVTSILPSHLAVVSVTDPVTNVTTALTYSILSVRHAALNTLTVLRITREGL